MSELITLEKFKSERKDLIKLWTDMSRSELLDAIWKESLDAVNMEKRVSYFMEECTDNMSKTTYTIDSLKTLIKDKKEKDIRNFCQDLIENEEDIDSEITKTIRSIASSGDYTF